MLAYPKLKNAPCPDKLWEKRHCVAEEGMYFEWRTTPWSDDQHRTVWCSRSDGLVVIGIKCLMPKEKLILEFSRFCVYLFNLR